LADTETPESPGILVVDDDENAVAAISRMLRHAGYSEIQQVTDSSLVMGHITSLRPSIVLLDLHMPELDGFELLDAIRSWESEHAYLPILVITADTSDEARSRAWSLGATDFIRKPFDHLELLPRIQSLLRSHALHRGLEERAENLEQRVRDRTQALEQAHAEVLVRLALAAEYRDDSTGEHTWRVGRLSALLARNMGVDATRHKLIERAARLHDVGKIGISDAILLKPDRLTNEEFEMMKAHTTIGAQLLSKGSSEVLQMAERVARSHHEHWDGTGYPDGLRGEDIPFEGRIVAVADVFDALTQPRSYKEQWTLREAVDEIDRQRECHFDPRVVDAFLEIADSGDLEKAERPPDAKFKSILPLPK